MKLNPTDYILLAYLNSAPIYTYKLAEILEKDKIDAWGKYSIPHLYYSLRRLKTADLVSIELQRKKSLPPQKVYSLTEKGRDILKNIGIDGNLITDETYFNFDLFLGLAEKLGIDEGELGNVINKRIDKLRTSLTAVQKKFREKELSGAPISPGEKLAFQHRVRFLKGEIDFYKKSLKEFKK